MSHNLLKKEPDIRPFFVSGRISGIICRISGRIPDIGYHADHIKGTVHKFFSWVSGYLIYKSYVKWCSMYYLFKFVCVLVALHSASFYMRPISIRSPSRIYCKVWKNREQSLQSPPHPVGSNICQTSLKCSKQLSVQYIWYIIPRILYTKDKKMW